MLARTQDNTKHIRELGFRRILKARQLDQKRTFLTPKLNFKAQDYSEIINWMDCDLCSPPLLKDMSDDEIKSHIQSDSVPNSDITFKTFPVQTQAVERCVKLVTEASGKVCGAESRDGLIRTTLLSRSTSPINQISKYLQLRMNENGDVQLFNMILLDLRLFTQ
ncbi:hypothetical protein AVEN_239507-1 [Araneus ventricosus]|uniref:Uncharacterized protein n=1 Tax=Araneus ventricosus TaxID=182803 RepID=A0A4Y2W1L3_ARAVE|nr:hypothetical protein AVEN_239507-1 [Araneus ventricosus]